MFGAVDTTGAPGVTPPSDRKEFLRYCRTASPALVAEILASWETSDALGLLSRLDGLQRAEIFSYISHEQLTALIEHMPLKELGEILSLMPSDDAVVLFKSLPEPKQVEVLGSLDVKKREDIRRLAGHPDRSAGALMTTGFMAVSPDASIAQALDEVRRHGRQKETIYYIYVIDQRGGLAGVITLEELILADPDSRVHENMHRRVLSVRVTQDQEEAAEIISKYDLLALPVVDAAGRMLGIITYDDAMDIMGQEYQEDMEKFMAISGPHEQGVYLRTSIWDHFRNRVFWVVVLAVLQLFSGMIIQGFEATLTALVILAFYIPMIIGAGGNTGSQSATLVVRALAVGEIAPRDLLRVLGKEFGIATLLAVVLGLTAYGKVMFLSGGVEIPPGFSLSIIGLAIALALAVQVITATLVGAVLPMAAAALKYDPAVMASPALTTLVDITGLFIYFSVAKLTLGL
ncbi:MAG: magnesium transporter [Pseudomonadota bacterium]